MGEIVNLRAARKARAKLENAQAGETSRLKSARTKAQRAADAARSDQAARLLDGRRRELPPPKPPGEDEGAER